MITFKDALFHPGVTNSWTHARKGMHRCISSCMFDRFAARCGATLSPRLGDFTSMYRFNAELRQGLGLSPFWLCQGDGGDCFGVEDAACVSLAVPFPGEEEPATTEQPKHRSRHKLAHTNTHSHLFVFQQVVHGILHPGRVVLSDLFHDPSVGVHHLKTEEHGISLS